MLSAKIAYFRPTGFDPRDLPGLVAYWPMSEDATLTNAQALDVGGSGFHLTSSGAVSNPGRNGSGRLLSASGTQWNPTPARLFRGSYNATPQFDANVAGWSIAFWVFTDLTYGTQGTGSTAAVIAFNTIASAGADIPRFSGGQPANGFASVSSRCYFTDNTFVSYQTGINIPGGLTSVTPNGQWTHLAFVADPVTRTYTMYVNGVARTPVTYAAGKTLSSFSSGMPCTIVWPGTIDELVVYNRAITASEVQRLAGVPLAPSAASTLHPECRSWISRVLSSGGTVSETTAAAVNNFCDAIDSAGLRDRFYRLNLFCGGNLSACLVPLYRGPSLGGAQFGSATDTNVNFTLASYVETGSTGGLLGNGTSRYLNTGLNASVIPDLSQSGHLSVYAAGTFSAQIALGVYTFTNPPLVITHESEIQLAATVANTFINSNANGQTPSYTSPVFVVGSRTSATNHIGYANGVAGTAVTTNANFANPAQPFFVFARNQNGAPVVHFGQRLRSYSIGLGMTGAQVTAFNTATQALQAALGRNV
jgi:hypothetical protein